MSRPTSLLVATVKNEGPNLLEWVAHHRLCGFDRIQIYQNDSTDTSVQTLRTLARIGAIDFFDNRHNKGAHQMRAYRRAARSEAYAKSDYCMVLDGDEFLNVHVGDGTVSDLIEATPDRADAILVNWRVFGSNGHNELGREWVTERYTRAEPADAIRETAFTPFKPLFRTKSFRRPAIHLPRDPLIDDPVFANGSGLLQGEFERKNWRSRDPKARALAQVNHYAVRDLGSFLLKHERGSANDPGRAVAERYWAQHDRNEEEDLSLAKRVPKLWEEIQALNEASGGQLLRLRARACRSWRLSLEALMKRPDILALRNAILAADQTSRDTEDAKKNDGNEGGEPALALTKPFRLPRPPMHFSSQRYRPSALAAE